VHDPHMHERGMLVEIEHPELGTITVPTTPLRLHGLGKTPAGQAPGSDSTTTTSTAAGSAWPRRN